MKKILPRSFFNRPTVTVARELLGKYIVRRREPGRSKRSGQRGRQGQRERNVALMITEVEAYDGPFDLASHASRGRSARTGHAAVMFGEAGQFYIYFTYGMHWLANIVTGLKNYPAAVLLRGGVYYGAGANEKTPSGGKNSGKNPAKEILISGPARLTKFLKIDGSLNGRTASKKSGLWFEDRGTNASRAKTPRAKIVTAKRVGVDYAGPIWSEKKYNFRIVSRSIASRRAVRR